MMICMAISKTLCATQQNSTEDTNTDTIMEDEDLDTPFSLSESKECSQMDIVYTMQNF